MGDAIRSQDWSRTPLGPMEAWPASLRATVSFCLSECFPSTVAWGPRHVMLYNDGYRSVCGGKHPATLGKDFAECWASAWPMIGQPFASALAGEAVFLQDQRLFLDRSGYLEEAFFVLSFSPVRDEGGGVGGVLNHCTETTAAALGERRARACRDVAARMATATAIDEVFQLAAATLGEHALDLPFVLFYRVDARNGVARLVGSTGIAPGTEASPTLLALCAEQPSWPLAEVVRARQMIALELSPRFGPLRCGPYPEPPRTAVLLPLRAAGNDELVAIMVAGVSARLPLDAAYESFHATLQAELSASLAHARRHEEERTRAALSELRLRAHHAHEGMLIAGVFAQAPVPVVVLRGDDLVCEAVNPAFSRAVAGGRDVRGTPLLEAFPELRGNGIVELALDVLHTGVPHVGREQPLRLSQDECPQETYWTFVHTPLRDQNGRTSGVLSIWNDVTEVVTARMRLEALAHQAEAANRTKDEFLAMLGHELRNPLSPIVTALQLMRMRGAESREQDVLERQVGNLVRLVDDLLDVSRIIRGKIELRLRGIELADVLLRAVETTSPLLEKRRHRLELRVARAGLGIEVDPDRMAQAFANLLTNAAKYSEPGAPIEVEAERAGEKIRVRFRDQGVGIASAMLEKVFDLFVQGPRQAGGTPGGLGLGLPIVRSLVEMHGGTVCARSDGPGKGSEFLVQLPASARAAPVVDPLAPCPAEGAERQAGRRVLVVDDNADAAETLKEALTKLGHAVAMAHDGRTALAEAEKFHPDVALIDIALPDMDGYELAGHLRHLSGRPDRPLHLVAVTGYGQESDRKRSAKAGFEEHLVKPVDLHELEELIRECGCSGG